MGMCQIGLRVASPQADLQGAPQTMPLSQDFSQAKTGRTKNTTTSNWHPKALFLWWTFVDSVGTSWQITICLQVGGNNLQARGLHRKRARFTEVSSLSSAQPNAEKATPIQITDG